MGVKDLFKRGFMVTLFSTGRLKRPDEIKRTTAQEDILGKRKEKDGADKDKLETDYGFHKENH
jgi:hypothetical protein